MINDIDLPEQWRVAQLKSITESIQYGCTDSSSNENTNSKYLAYCIQQNKNYFEKKSTSTTVQYLNKENCNSMPFPLCGIEKQNKVVEELEGKLTICDNIEETINHSLQQAETLKQSILKKAFEGKLIVPVVNEKTKVDNEK